MDRNTRWFVQQSARLDQMREHVRGWFGRCMSDESLYSELDRFVSALNSGSELTGGDLTLAKLLANLHICQLAIDRFEKIHKETEIDS